MMLSQKTVILLASCLLVAGCFFPAQEKAINASGAKSGIASTALIKRKDALSRPSGQLGIFAGIFLSKGIIMPVSTAVTGIESLQLWIQGQQRSGTDENFALLIETGEVLQVKIFDALNRSTDRVQTLDEYTLSLKSAIDLMNRKISEIKALQENKKEELKTKRNTMRDTERTLKTAIKNQDYMQAGQLEQELSEATGNLAKAETEEKQARDMQSRFETLLEIAGDRLQAIENNREILIAGLRVINVPGISDLNILEEGKSWSRRRRN